MTVWAAKRFWSAAAPCEEAGGWGVALDGRPVRTPARAPLLVPTRALAAAIAAEWDAQSGEVRPATMPLTRAANSAIDRVAPARAEIAAALAAYGGTDLLCYRADGPAALVRRQAAAWDPILARAAAAGAPLRVTSGIVHVAQPKASLEALAARLAPLDPFRLAAVHDLVTISGSLLLGLAVLDRTLPAAEAFALSRLDEDWQIEQWGEDAEAAAATGRARADFLRADTLLSLLGA